MKLTSVVGIALLIFVLLIGHMLLLKSYVHEFMNSFAYQHFYRIVIFHIID